MGDGLRSAAQRDKFASQSQRLTLIAVGQVVERFRGTRVTDASCKTSAALRPLQKFSVSHRGTQRTGKPLVPP
jgi:hypothetical protein